MSPIDPPPPPNPPPPSSSDGSAGLDVGAAFRWGWKKFRENAATFVLATLIIVAVAVVLNFALQTVVDRIFGSGDVRIDPDTLEVSGGRSLLANLFFTLLASSAASIVTYFLQAGVIRASLKVADGGKPDLGSVFTTEQASKTFITALLLAAGVLVGTLLCYLPGLLFSIATAYSLYFLVDNDVEPIDSIKKSVRFVFDNIGQLILLFLASIAALIVGAILCGIGLLVAIPVVLLANAYAFRTLTGGRVTA